MAFFKELMSNVNWMAKNQFSSKPVSNTEVGLTQISMQANNDPNFRETVYPQWFFSARLGQPRDIEISTIRKLSKSAWVQMVLSTFKKQISSIPWQVVKEDEEDETDRSEDIKKVTEFLNRINSDNQSVDDIHSESITDLGEIDAGCWNYVYSLESYEIGDIPVYDAHGRIESYEQGIRLKPFGQRELTKVKVVDGGTMLKQVDIHKNLLNYWQYSFKNPRQNPTRYERDEIQYLILNKRSYDVYGFSPVQAVQQVLELLIQGTRYNKDLYTNNAIPDYLVSLPNIELSKLKELKRRWNNSYKGKPHQVGFINWMIDKIQKLADSNRDLEWLDGQKWYFKLVFGIFGVSPTEAGFFENSNKSNDEGQEKVTVRNALKPYMKLLERAHKKTIDEILQRTDHGLCFKFFPQDQQAEKIEFEQDMKQLEMGVITINEYRNKNGLDPVDWGDEPLRKPFDPSQSFFNFGGNQSQPNPKEPPEEEDESNEGKEKNYPAIKDYSKKKDELKPGEDIIEEAEDYSDFLLKTFNRFERKVLSAVDKIDIQKKVSKTFGEFMSDMFNVVNTKKFAGQVKKYLKADLVRGMVAAEKETNVDIGFTQAYQDKLNVLQAQQVDGYTINGKKWPGIKGVTKEIQHNVIKSVQEGLNKDKTLEEIKTDIKKVFDGFSDWRSELIGRTETNRIINSAKLLGYKETGLDGGKIVMVALDNRTSPICKRMHKKYGNNPIPLDDPFIDDETKKEFLHTPFHCNCRSVLAFRAK